MLALEFPGCGRLLAMIDEAVAQNAQVPEAAVQDIDVSEHAVKEVAAPVLDLTHVNAAQEVEAHKEE